MMKLRRDDCLLPTGPEGPEGGARRQSAAESIARDRVFAPLRPAIRTTVWKLPSPLPGISNRCACFLSLSSTPAWKKS